MASLSSDRPVVAWLRLVASSCAVARRVDHVAAMSANGGQLLLRARCALLRSAWNGGSASTRRS